MNLLCLQLRHDECKICFLFRIILAVCRRISSIYNHWKDTRQLKCQNVSEKYKTIFFDDWTSAMMQITLLLFHIIFSQCLQVQIVIWRNEFRLPKRSSTRVRCLSTKTENVSFILSKNMLCLLMTSVSTQNLINSDSSLQHWKWNFSFGDRQISLLSRIFYHVMIRNAILCLHYSFFMLTIYIFLCLCYSPQNITCNPRTEEVTWKSKDWRSA